MPQHDISCDGWKHLTNVCWCQKDKCEAKAQQSIKRYMVYVDMICDLEEGHDGDHWEPSYLLYWPGSLGRE